MKNLARLMMLAAVLFGTANTFGELPPPVCYPGDPSCTLNVTAANPAELPPPVCYPGDPSCTIY